MKTLFGRWTLLGIWLCAAALVVPACDGQVGGGTDSNTHWLAFCQNEGEDCGGGLQCLCGICTKPCTEDAACGGLGKGATCMNAACSQAATKSCTLKCATNDDCRESTHDYGLFCRAGQCVAPTTSDAGASATDVCPTTFVDGAPCNGPSMTCRTACAGGFQTQFACDGGHWVAGHGLFPCADGGVSSACTQSLTESGCAPTYEQWVAAGRCDSFASVVHCGDLRFASGSVVDVAQTCAYDASGALVGARTCSKPVGGCNCFTAGDVNLDACQGSVGTSPCATDAGHAPLGGGDCTKLDFSQYPKSSALSFTNDIVPIFAAHLCAASDCHNSAQKKAGLDLGPLDGQPPFDPSVVATMYASLVAPSTTVNGGTVKRVAPGDPGHSFLVDTLDGTQNDRGYQCTNQDPSHAEIVPPLPCGDDMPMTGPGENLCTFGGVSRDEFNQIVTWIASGAKND